MDTAIYVAVIGFISAVIVALIQVGRKDNSRDHAKVSGALDRIENKIDTHLIDHTRKRVKKK